MEERRQLADQLSSAVFDECAVADREQRRPILLQGAVGGVDEVSP
jgi:hypothetical protein